MEKKTEPLNPLGSFTIYTNKPSENPHWDKDAEEIGNIHEYTRQIIEEKLKIDLALVEINIVKNIFCEEGILSVDTILERIIILTIIKDSDGNEEDYDEIREKENIAPTHNLHQLQKKYPDTGVIIKISEFIQVTSKNLDEKITELVKRITKANPFYTEGIKLCIYSDEEEIGEIVVFNKCENDEIQINYKKGDKAKLDKWISKYTELNIRCRAIENSTIDLIVEKGNYISKDIVSYIKENSYHKYCQESLVIIEITDNEENIKKMSFHLSDEVTELPKNIKEKLLSSTNISETEVLFTVQIIPIHNKI